jgi:hypothetical protein
VLSNISSPVISKAEDNLATEDQASFKTNDSLEVIKLGSDEKLKDLEKELGLSKFSSYLITSLIPIHSSSQEKLEVPDILILQS